MADTKIEWTDSTWNPVTGCTKISAGCLNCYAERMTIRLKAMGQPNYANGFKEVTCHERQLKLPLQWKKSRMIFVNSMSDLFHEEVPFAFIQSVFDVMNQAHWHTFQVLTKRAEHLYELAKHLDWSPNIWMGVSVENQAAVERIDYLRQTAAHVKFLSMEPLIGRVKNLNVSGIDWVIVGGESGPGARPMEEQWVIEIKESCETFAVPFFFKQWGGVNKKRAGRVLLDKTWDAMPNETTSL
ncbi:MAG: phage Gp37/Gp68 family protein, partial [Planctomycetaceae bacterium]|nr:phage Gp37/Gp68 family protein [Planctomycetaceae bacterium]